MIIVIIMILLLVITVINIKIAMSYTGFFGEKVCFDSILTSLYAVDAVSFLMDTFWRIENYCYLTRFSSVTFSVPDLGLRCSSFIWKIAQWRGNTFTRSIWCFGMVFGQGIYIEIYQQVKGKVLVKCILVDLFHQHGGHLEFYYSEEDTMGCLAGDAEMLCV